MRSVLFVSILLFATVSFAASAGISGRILDPLGAVVPSAKVQLVKDGSVVSESVADQQGSFHFDSIAPGRYAVQASAAGFSSSTTSVIVRSDAAARVDLTLHIGTLAQQVVVSATGTETPDSQLGASVSVINSDDLQYRLNVIDVLRITPGLQIQQTGGLGGKASVFVRGGNSNSNKVLIDGVPANEIGGSFEFANLASTAVDKVEIFRGPNSVLYGSDAIGSVINVTSRRGTTRLPELTLEGSGGTFSTYDYAGALAGAYRNFDYFSAASRTDSQNNVPNTAYHNGTFAGNYGWTPTASTDLRVTVRRNASVAGLSNAFDLYKVADDSFLKEQNTYMSVTLQNQTTVRWHNLVRYGAARLTLQSVNPTPTGTPFDPFGFGANYLGKTVTLCAPTGCATPGQAILDFGGGYPSLFDSMTNRDFVQTQSDYFLNSHLTALFSFRFEDERGITNSSFSNDHTDRKNFSYTMQAQGNLWTRLYATVGVGLEDNAVFGFAATPKVSLAYYLLRPSDTFFSGTKLKFNFGKGIKEPSIFEETSSLFSVLSKTSPQLISQFHVSPTGPERSRSFDFGFDQAFLNGRAKLGVTFFHNRFYDQLEFVDKTLLPQLGVPPQVASALTFGAAVNASDYRVRGVETELEFNLGRGFIASGTYTHQSAVVTKSFSSDNQFPTINPAFPNVLIGAFSPLVGSRPFRRAPHSGSFALSYFRQRFTAAFNGYFVGRRDDSTFLTDAFFGTSLLLPNRNLSPAYQKIDFTGSYAIHPAVTLFTSMENVLNQHYDSVYGFPSLPFTVRAGMKFVIGGETWKLKSTK